MDYLIYTAISAGATVLVLLVALAIILWKLPAIMQHLVFMAEDILDDEAQAREAAEKNIDLKQVELDQLRDKLEAAKRYQEIVEKEIEKRQ